MKTNVQKDEEVGFFREKFAGSLADRIVRAGRYLSRKVLKQLNCLLILQFCLKKEILIG